MVKAHAARELPAVVEAKRPAHSRILTERRRCFLHEGFHGKNHGEREAALNQVFS